MKVDVVVVKRRKKVEVTVARRSCTPSMEHIHYVSSDPKSVHAFKPMASAVSAAEQEPVPVSGFCPEPEEAVLAYFLPEPEEAPVIGFAPAPVTEDEQEPVSFDDFETEDELLALIAAQEAAEQANSTVWQPDQTAVGEDEFADSEDSLDYERYLDEDDDESDDDFDDESAPDNAAFNIRFYDRDSDGERVETDRSSASGQEIVYYDAESGRPSRICGIIRKGASHEDIPDDSFPGEDDEDEDSTTPQG